MSSQISQTTVDTVHKLDDMPQRSFESVLPYQYYSKQDIKDAADLITKMLKWVPKDRISCRAALNHRFFKDVEVP